MTPAEFIKKWGDNTLRERQGAQSHFNDLCALIGGPTPTEDDPFGERSCFERGAEKEVLARLFALNQERAATGR